MRKRWRFTSGFKAKVVLEVLTGAQSPAEARRTHTLSPNLLGLWTATVLERARPLFQPGEQRDEDQAPASPSSSNCTAGPRARSRL